MVGRRCRGRAREGHEAIVKLLLERDDVAADSKDGYGRTPLWWAAGEGHEEVVKLLLERYNVAADSKDNNSRAPLWWAARGGYEAVMKLLLERDNVAADPKDEYGRTPLWWAAEREQLSGREAAAGAGQRRRRLEGRLRPNAAIVVAERGHETTTRAGRCRRRL